jgi:hypothetical protein
VHYSSNQLVVGGSVYDSSIAPGIPSLGGGLIASLKINDNTVIWAKIEISLNNYILSNLQYS